MKANTEFEPSSVQKAAQQVDIDFIRLSQQLGLFEKFYVLFQHNGWKPCGFGEMNHCAAFSASYSEVVFTCVPIHVCTHRIVES